MSSFSNSITDSKLDLYISSEQLLLFTQTTAWKLDL